ncbi:MAG: sugar phosphate isomerase/epimerase family protein [Candidatus Faecivicinus sp.]
MNVATTTRAIVRNSSGGRYSIFQTLDLLKEAGFTIIDWYAPECELLGEGDGICDAERWRRWAHEVREYAAKLGLRFCQMHALDQNYAKGEAYAQYISIASERTFLAAEILGIRDVAIHPVISVPERRQPDRCIEDNVAYFSKLADTAGRYGLRLAIENMLSKRHFDGQEEWRFCTEWRTHCELVSALDFENVGYCFDVGHANYTGTDPYDVPVAMGRRLFAVHVHDNDAFSDQHLLPYQGTIDFDRFTQGLADSGYSGNMTMEVINAANRMPDRMARLTLKAIYESAVHLADKVEAAKHAAGKGERPSTSCTCGRSSKTTEECAPVS